MTLREFMEFLKHEVLTFREHWTAMQSAEGKTEFRDYPDEMECGDWFDEFSKWVESARDQA
jgi:hypothetical protein